MKLSIVTTVYKSEHFLKGFVTQSLEAVEKAEIDDFELVFVIDGITDQSIALLLNEKENTPQIKIVELTRNFGHHFAITAGLEQASGEWVFLIDCDLEVSPLVLVDFLNKQKEADADVVYGIQKVRKGSALERVLGGFFWKIFNLLSETPLPPNLMTERLMNRAYVQSLLSLGDKNLFLGGMMHWVGYNQIPLEIEKTPRSGKSSYSLLKRLSLLENAITSFSEYPLKLIFRLGLIIVSISLSTIVYFTLRKLLFPQSILLGYTSLMIAVILSLGIVTSSIGVVGIYIARVFKQTQDRPKYIIKKVFD